jgi:glycosyltransferase involved in cell wall biosynthesis
MKIILNGMGCPYSGARLVLVELLKTVSDDLEILAIVPKVSKDDNYEFVNKRIKLIKLNVKYWSLYLRPLLEIWVNIVKVLFNYHAVFNISNYGLCLTRNQTLYIHNQYILDMSAKQQFGGGYPNVITRAALNTFLRKAEAIFLQSDHIYQTLTEYCKLNGIPVPKNVSVLTPHPMIDEKKEFIPAEKDYAFQFFYPASDFEHKRVDLAVGGIISFNRKRQDVGLIITADEPDEKNSCIKYLKQIPHKDVLERTYSSDAIIFTSEREALGLPLLEALYFGKPAILPDLPYAHEIYGKAGVYFKSFTIDEIESSIDELYSNHDKYKELSKTRKNEIWPKLKTWSEHWDAFKSAVSKNT